MKIHYEPHPVSPERKAELVAQGLKIIDAKFATESAAPVIPTKSDIATMKKGEVKGWLAAHGVDNPDGSVSKLRDQLRAIMFVE